MPAYLHSSMFCASNSVAGMEEIQFALSVKVKIPPQVLLGIIAQFTAPYENPKIQCRFQLQDSLLQYLDIRDSQSKPLILEPTL